MTYRLIVLLAAAAMLLAGCGGSSGDDEDDAEAVIQSFKELKPGEILIQGLKAEKFSGPHRLRKGGYVLTFERTGDEGTLSVSLESVRGSTRPPYQLVLKESRAETGRRPVTVSGQLWVHIRSSADSYVVRLTPKKAAQS
jgi:hypothetical protein